MKFFLPVFVCKFLKSIVALVKATINTINRIIIFYVLREKCAVLWCFVKDVKNAHID